MPIGCWHYVISSRADPHRDLSSSRAQTAPSIPVNRYEYDSQSFQRIHQLFYSELSSTAQRSCTLADSAKEMASGIWQSAETLRWSISRCFNHGNRLKTVRWNSTAVRAGCRNVCDIAHSFGFLAIRSTIGLGFVSLRYVCTRRMAKMYGGSSVPLM